MPPQACHRETITPGVSRKEVTAKMRPEEQGLTCSRKKKNIQGQKKERMVWELQVFWDVWTLESLEGVMRLGRSGGPGR